MANLNETLKQLEISAGGPGSGRKPEFVRNTPNKDELNNLHNKLTKQGFNFDKTMQKGTKVSQHQYTKESKNGNIMKKQLWEDHQKGEHEITN